MVRKPYSFNRGSRVALTRGLQGKVCIKLTVPHNTCCTTGGALVFAKQECSWQEERKEGT